MTEEELKFALILLGFKVPKSYSKRREYLWTYRTDKYHIEHQIDKPHIDIWDDLQQIYLLKTTDIDAVYNKLTELLEEKPKIQGE